MEPASNSAEHLHCLMEPRLKAALKAVSKADRRPMGATLALLLEGPLMARYEELRAARPARKAVVASK